MAPSLRLNTAEIIAQAVGADLARALAGCHGELREHAFNMLDAINDPEADAMDREFAAITLAEILYPDVDGSGNYVSYDLSATNWATDFDAAEVDAVERELDAEEATFAERLLGVMREQNVTQAALAERVGLHQSAISMMLSRDCRPRKRTVTKLAEALGVEPAALWPNFAAKS